ncbi:hypothetical protein [Gracilibacillus xinjiangensis]|uniref:Asp/Glu racemase n=1 Tax=Gracilibacillus xinjiangensis TaxID=1193282 RepID=A0ABV8WSV2_9BACI
MKRIGCLHAHHSNINYIEHALAPFKIELVHFVDPGLMYHLTPNSTDDIAVKVKEQLNWISSCDIDATLITCTNYIALLDELSFASRVPIIKIDEPFFEQVCRKSERQILLFTNPATITGTMNRLYTYAAKQKKSININAWLIENSFDLLMNGQSDAYNQLILDYIGNDNNTDLISVAQLSMVEAVNLSGKDIGNPLNALVKHVVQQFDLEKQV